MMIIMYNSCVMVVALWQCLLQPTFVKHKKYIYTYKEWDNKWEVVGYRGGGLLENICHLVQI